MRIIVSDSSCLIDLRKASLLEALLGLPYEIVIPDTLFEEELLKFTQKQKKRLLQGGLKIIETPGDGVARARTLATKFPSLSIHDCFAFSLAEQYPGCILLSGDRSLRTIAIEHDIEVHGVLWAIDEMHQAATATVEQLCAALLLFESDPTVRLPLRDVRAFIKRYKSLR
jgi:hypothetical protein